MNMKQLIGYIRGQMRFDFYANEFPRSVKTDCGFVRLEGGTPPDIYIPNFRTTGIQILIRHKDVEQATILAKEIWDLFHAKEHYYIGDYEIKLSACNQPEPIYVGTDKNERTIFSVNITCHYVDWNN